MQYAHNASMFVMHCKDTQLRQDHNMTQTILYKAIYKMMAAVHDANIYGIHEHSFPLL